MKKILTLLALSALLIGCDDDGGKTSPSVGGDWNTLTFEGCEYIYKPMPVGTRSLVHKGNCSNSIHFYSNTLLTDTLYIALPIDSVEVAVGYLKSNGAFRGQ